MVTRREAKARMTSDVPAGTYYVRVSDTNWAGASEASPEVAFTVFSQQSR
jgi:hypothetical protein